MINSEGMIMIKWALLALGSYLVGAVPTGVLVAHCWNGKDIQHEGSRNIGATNVARVVGKAAGIITLLGDITKGVVPVLAIRSMMAGTNMEVSIYMAVAGFSVFLGHLFPLYLGFKGGKGVATALGVFLVVAPLAVFPAALVFAVTVGLWRYISLGSLVGAASVPIFVALFGYNSVFVLLGGAIAVLIFLKHRPNIERLLRGEENRLSWLKKQHDQK
jgi:acyl phosphate:glycerol-3-phosphate acyltransferase